MYDEILFSAQGTQATRLANGLTVLVHEDQRFPLVSIRLLIRAGSVHESPDQAGISHMVEHMVFKGTAARGPGRVAAEIEGFGGELNAITGFDATMYIMNVPDEHWVAAMEVLRDMIFEAVIDAKELESERLVILAELDQGQDQPQRVLFQAVQKTLWPDIPYGRPVIGFKETVQDISRDDMLRFIRERYQPGAMLLVLCGNISHGEALSQARRLFGDLANHDDHDLPSPKTILAGSTNPRLVVERGAWRKVHFAMALPIPGLGSAQSAGLDVLAHMLGGDRTSLLYRTLKHEQGVVDGISVSATCLEKAGMLYIQAQLDPENIHRLWTGLISTLAGLNADAFTPGALDRAKLNLEDSLFRAKETISGIASKLGYFQFHEHSVGAEERYVHLVRNMDSAQLNVLIKEHIRPGRLACVIYTPEPEALDPEGMLKLLGEKWLMPLTPMSARKRFDSNAREIIDLAQGRTLALLPDASLPYTALNLSWAGGDLLLGPHEQGLAEMTARVWTKGTENMSAVEIQNFLAERAALVGAGAGLEKFVLSASFPERFSTDLLHFIKELINSPSWAMDELDRAKRDQTSTIVRSEDHPVGLAFRHIFPFLYPGHPYGYLHSGATETIQGFSREQVASFWLLQKSKPWVLSVSGDFDRQEIMDMATEIATEMQVPVPDLPAPAWGEHKEMILQLADRNQAHVFVIFPAPGMVHADTAGLRLLREVLAGQSGMLFKDLRDVQGLAYAVSAFLWQNGLTGFLALYIATSPDRLDDALCGFQMAVSQLRQGPLKETDLARAKNLLWGDYHRDRQPLMARGHEASEALSRGLHLDHELHVLEQARKLGSEDLIRLVEKYLQWDQAYFLKVTP